MTRNGSKKTKRARAPKTERLHKYIANCGYCSRRHAERLVANGLVRVNGKVVQGPLKIVPKKDTVSIHGETIVPPAPVTVVLNKPAGYITSTHDTHDRMTVMDLLPKKLVAAGVLPAGRLDKDSEGLLILTNDGDLQHRITHPRYECHKEYRVHVARPPNRRERSHLEQGVFLEELNKRTSHARVLKIRQRRDGTATLHIVIHEGMKRQVRRMFESLGIKVLYLERLAIGGLRLGHLPRGKWRQLKPPEIRRLERDEP